MFPATGIYISQSRQNEPTSEKCKTKNYGFHSLCSERTKLYRSM